MTDADFRKLCNEIVDELRRQAPRRTGNLADNAIRFEFVGNTCNIYVDEEIAPYMPYTNEKWLSPKWNGKQNPNEAWWQDTIENKIVKGIAAKVRGVVKW